MPRSKTQAGLIAVACAGATCVANATWWLQPLLIDQFLALGRYGLSGIGLVISVEMAAMALTASVLSRWMSGGRFLWIGAVGIGMAALASLASLFTTAFWPTIAARMLVGAGEGVCLMVANTAIVQLGDPDRDFARLGVVNVLFGVVLVTLMPLVHFSIPQPAALVALTITLFVLAVPMLAMPPAQRLLAEPGADAGVLESDGWARILLVSLATLAIGVASGVLWSFYAIIGGQAGLGEAAINGAIAASIFSAIPGSGLAAVLGGRVGRVMPLAFGLTLMTGAIVTLSLHPGPAAFRIATCINVGSLYFMMPYFFAIGAAQDKAGRGGAFVSSAFFMSGAIGPYLGGVLAETVGTQVMGLAAVVISILSFCTFFLIERRPRGR